MSSGYKIMFKEKNMNRRFFLITLTSILAGASSITAFAAELIWLKPGGNFSYKEKSPNERKCLTCIYFKDDSKAKDGGLCSFKGISKNSLVYVKKDGVCSMFKRKST